MRAVNLLPRDAETRSGGSRRLPLAAGLALAVVSAAAVFLVFSASGTIDERRAELSLTESAIAAIPRADESAAPSGLVVQERADRVAALSAALSSRVAVDRLLRELSYVLPEDAWLTGMIANAPTTADPGAATPGGAQAQASAAAAGVTIQGATFSHESVARILGRLALLPTLENVRLTASARIEPQVEDSGAADGKGTKKVAKPRRAVVTFTISADLRSGGAQ